MNSSGVSTFDLQAAILAELGMEVPGAWQWLSDTWLLAERAALPPVASGGGLRQAVYLELDGLERFERAAILRSAVRFEIRRTAVGPAGGGEASPAQDLRAAALDLVLPCPIASSHPMDRGERDSSAAAGDGPTTDDRRRLAALLRREGARPVSERLFGPREGRRGRDRADATGIPQPDAACDPAWVLDAICGAPAPLPVQSRTPSVNEALWGLVQLAAALDPSVESSIAALECRLVLGAGEKSPGGMGDGFPDTASLGATLRHGNSEQGTAVASWERIELARLVVSGQFEDALSRSRAGELVGDESLSLTALRAALRHRGADRRAALKVSNHLQKQIPSVPNYREAAPNHGEIQRIARFLASIEQAWPGPSRADGGGLRETGSGIDLLSPLRLPIASGRDGGTDS